MAVLIGNDLFLYLNGVAVAMSRTCTFNATSDEIDVTSKDSAKAYAMKPGRVKATLSCDGLVELVSSATANVDNLLTKLKAGTAVSWKFTENASSEDYIHGATAYIVSIDLNATENSEATYSASLTVSGTWNITTKT